MMPARAVATEMLRWNDLKPLCESPGPCITITLPTFHHGARALPYATQLKASARTAHEELLLKQTPLEELEALMDPIVELQEDPEMSVGGRGMVIFRSPTVFRRFYLLGPVGARTVVGRYFHLVPFLDPLRTDREFYILGLNQKHIRLLHYLDGDCEEVPLPAAVPKNVEEAGAFDSPDHMLRNRSAAGKSSGSMSGVVFGTGSEREKGNERLHHFFSLVDKGLSDTLKGKPLMLSGARYEVASYRRSAAYPALSAGDLEGDLHTLSVQEIAHLAYQLTHKTMICRSKCRPLNRSSIGTNRCISSSSSPTPRLHQIRGQGHRRRRVSRIYEDHFCSMPYSPAITRTCAKIGLC